MLDSESMKEVMSPTDEQFRTPQEDPKPEQVFTIGERNDIKEDLVEYRRFLINQLDHIQDIEAQLQDKEHPLGVSSNNDTLLNAIRLRIDGPKQYQIHNTREWKARRELIMKIQDLSTK